MLASVAVQPSISCRKVYDEVGVRKSRTQLILKKYKFKPYKFHLVQHLHPGDAERRVIFCNWYLQILQENANFERRVIWSDEAYFTSSGILNRNNSRYWSQENQHVIFTRERQGRFGFSVSCFILGAKIKYVIYEGTLTGIRHLDIMRDALMELLEDVPLADLNNIYYQQDGAPSHNSRIVREYLETTFPDKWIGTNGPVRWPPRSPDLSVLDFFLWGYIENQIYKKQYHNIDQLREATHQTFRLLQGRPITLLNALRRIETVCGKCLEHNGAQFEQFL